MQLSRMAQRAGAFVPTVAVLAVAVLVRAMSWLNNDASGLITFAARMLDGARPYIDFREVNPPAALLLYLPSVLLGRWLRIPPEAALTIGIFAATAISLWLAARILEAASLLARWEGLALAPLLVAILLILPEYSFGQREHIALVAMLPLLAIFAARAVAKPVGRIEAVIAGIGGGIAASIKPYFALPLLFSLLYVVWTRRREPKAVLRLFLGPEVIAAAFVVATYAAVVIFAFPEYLQVMLPIARTVYIPSRLPWLALLLSPSVVLVVLGLAATAIIGFRTALRPFPFVFVLAALGFMTGAIVQGKGWPYHSYPAIALLLSVSCAVAIRRWPEFRTSGPYLVAPRAVSALFLIVGLYVISSVWFRPLSWYPPYVAAVMRLAPPHPKIAAICGGTQYVYPLVRIVQGRSVDEVLWVNDAVFALRLYGNADSADQDTVERYARSERTSFVRSLTVGKPDVLVVCKGWKAWALAQPDFAAALHKFHVAAVLENLELWLPNRA